MDADIKVIVKLRPLLGGKREDISWKVNLEKGEITQLKNKVTGELSQPMGSQKQLETFAFESVFEDTATNKDVYNAQCKATVRSVLEGYNGTIFLYGQTKSGKTYTMQGDRNDPGILYHSLKEIFDTRDRHHEKKIKIYISYLEIYNEGLIDLLNPKGDPTSLKIAEDAKIGIIINGLRQQKVRTIDEAIHLLHFGEEFRALDDKKYRVTDYNAHSSRSHTIFKVYVETDHSEDAKSSRYTFSCLNLVDLAGSERLSMASENEDNDKDKETKFINKSLFYLTKVIHLLSIGNQHIPFRDSKLTRILSDALGGNSLTVLIANISPLSQDIIQTVSTLKFASRAKTVKTQPKRMEILKEEENAEIQRLNAVVNTLDDVVKGKEKQMAEMRGVIKELKETIDKFRLKIGELEEANAGLQLSLQKEGKELKERKQKEEGLVSINEALRKQNLELKARLDDEIKSKVELAAALKKSNFKPELKHKFVQTVISLSTERDITKAAHNEHRNNDDSIDLPPKKSKVRNQSGFHSLKQNQDSPNQDLLSKLFGENYLKIDQVDNGIKGHGKTDSLGKENNRPYYNVKRRATNQHIPENDSIEGSCSTIQISNLPSNTKAAETSLTASILEKRKKRQAKSISREKMVKSPDRSIEKTFYKPQSPRENTLEPTCQPSLARLTQIKNSFLMRVTTLMEKISEDKDSEALSTILEFCSGVLSVRGTLLRQSGLTEAYTSLQAHKATSQAIPPKVKNGGIETEGAAAAKQRLLKGFNSTPDSFLLGWGDCSEGKVGVDPNLGVLSTPTFIPVGSVKKVALGGHFSLALDQKGRIFAWGRGDLMGCDSVDRHKPTLIKELSSKMIVQLACGVEHSLALSSEGVVFTWGFDQFGQLGRGSKSIVSMPKPQPLPKLLDKFIDRIFAGPYSSAAITRKDELFVWGDNYPSKLFLDTQSAIISSPTQTLVGKCPLQISLSQSHSACMDLTSRLLLTTAFSSTINNTLSGSVALHSSQSNPSWSEVSLLNDRPRQFFAGKGFTVLLTSKGKVIKLTKDEIVEVNLPGRVEKLLGHGDYSVAVQTEDGQWYAWGDNSCQTISPQAEERIAVPVRMQFDDEITVSSVVFSNSHAAALYNKKNSQVIQ